MAVKYYISGMIGYWKEHYQNDPKFIGKEFGYELRAASDKEAVAKAKDIAKDFFKRNEHLAPSTEIPKLEGSDTGVYKVELKKVATSIRGATEITRSKMLWIAGFISGDPPEPEVPAKPEVIIPAVEAIPAKPGKPGRYYEW